MSDASRQRPLVLLNMAISADGKIATANRAVHSFGSARDLRHLYELRATADAILCGARTLEMEGATLGHGGGRFLRMRRRRGLADHALRVVVSGTGSISPEAAIFRHRFSPILVLTTRRAARRRLDALRRVADVVRVSGGMEVDITAALRWLRSEWGVQRLLCEGGGELNDTLFRAGVVDEIHLTLCPRVFGGRDAPSIAGGLGVDRLADACRFELQSVRRTGDELFLIFRRLAATPAR